MANTTKTAEAQFRKIQRDVDGKKALSEYEAEQVALRARTAKLRALRLARDAAQAPASGTAAPAPAAKAAGKKAKPKRPALADFLKDQQSSGRNS